VSERICLYEIVEGGEPVYAGISIKPKRRFMEHKARGLCSRTATIREVEWFCDLGTARAAEERHIGTTRHKKNRLFNRMPTPLAREIWFSHRNRPASFVIQMMDGWSINYARITFGPR
jgi:predicted GIY-YIG superfamily endonuclease